MSDDNKKTNPEDIDAALDDYLDNEMSFIINDQFIANALTAQAQLGGLIEERDKLSVISIEELQENTFGVECKLERQTLH